MTKMFLARIFGSLSDNPKSKIQNLKWLGLSVIAFVLVVTGAVTHAQQPTKTLRVGYLSNASPAAMSATPRSRAAPTAATALPFASAIASIPTPP